MALARSTPPSSRASSNTQANNTQGAVSNATISADQSLAAQEKLAAEGRAAALFTAQQKLLNDLNDAVVSFIKNIGSSVKTAAQ